MSLSKRVFLPFIVILVFFFQLAIPRVARADDSQPPEVVPTEVPVDPGGGTGDPAEDESLTVPEILDQAPADTEIAVVNDQGDLEPLATQEAAAIIANADPWWCPTSEDPGTIGNSCVQGTTIDDLITALDTANTSAPGTIYFQGDAAGGGFTLDSTNLPDLYTNTLGLEGGWDLTLPTPVKLTGTSGISTFSGPIVIHWANSVSLADITVTATTGSSAIDVTTTGDVVLDTVSATDSILIDPSDGASIAASGDVTVTDSTFNNSTGYGLYVNSTGAVTLNTVTADNNAYGGAVASNYNGTGIVNVTGGQYNDNGSIGLEIESSGDVTVATGVFDDNDYYGLDINTTGTVDVSGVDASGNDAGLIVGDIVAEGDVSVSNSTFNNNVTGGLGIETDGNITVTGVTATFNQFGSAQFAFGNITDTQSTFTNNTDLTGLSSSYGLIMISESGDVTLNQVVADGNGTAGFFGDSCDFYDFDGGVEVLAVDGSVTVTGLLATPSSMSTNNGIGLKVDTYGMAGTISVDHTNVIDNTESSGALLSADGDILVDSSTFSGNDDIGVQAYSGGTITLSNVTANDNGFAGAWTESWSETASPAISVTGSDFSNNGSYGLKIFGSTSASVNTITANLNGQAGIYIDYLAPCGVSAGIDVSVTGDQIEDNGAFGIEANVGPTGSLNVSPSTIYDPDHNGTPTAAANDVSLVNEVHPCPPPDDNDEEKPPEPEPRPFNEVNLPDNGGEPVQQDCELYAGLILTLPNGDNSQVACPAEGSFLVEHVAEADLPGALPPGPKFVSALTVSGVDADGNPVLLLPDGASLVVSFDIPEGMERAHFAIMYWDQAANDGAGKWVELPTDLFSHGISALHHDTPEDNMLILRGVHQDGGKVTVKVNFTGTFVLIAK